MADLAALEAALTPFAALGKVLRFPPDATFTLVNAGGETIRLQFKHFYVAAELLPNAEIEAEKLGDRDRGGIAQIAEPGTKGEM